jgi:outer membrane protein assembly factor BamD (BamD/ComL family)
MTRLLMVAVIVCFTASDVRVFGEKANSSAERDFQLAEFYWRTEHPGAAYFYDEVVQRRYPGTSFAEKARQRVEDVRTRAARDFQLAEFYRRAGHVGSASFYYEWVSRRYRGTSFAEKAKERIQETHRPRD